LISFNLLLTLFSAHNVKKINFTFSGGAILKYFGGRGETSQEADTRDDTSKYVPLHFFRIVLCTTST